MSVVVPNWNTAGVLPPCDEVDPTSFARSPYRVSVLALVERFATSTERVAILRGYLAYRASLHRLGLITGFQWVDGSFIEDVERVEARAPNDVDVVSFLLAPRGSDAGVIDGDHDALDNAAAKSRFRVDGYFVELDYLEPREITSITTYWYSLWSHRRNGVWKGFIEVELDPGDDAAAETFLDSALEVPDGESP